MRGSTRSAICLLGTLVTSAIGHLANAEASGTVGVRSMAVLAPERGVMLEVRVWYPAGAGGTAVAVS